METKASRSIPSVPGVPQPVGANAGIIEGEIELFWKSVPKRAATQSKPASIRQPRQVGLTSGLLPWAGKVIANLTSGKRYWFRVAGVSAGGQSGWS